jgi:hypothetical protein
MHWGSDDVRLILDLLGFQAVFAVVKRFGPALRLWVMEAYIKPALVFIGQKAYRKADDAMGGALPDFLRGDPPPPPPPPPFT